MGMASAPDASGRPSAPLSAARGPTPVDPWAEPAAGDNANGGGATGANVGSWWSQPNWSSSSWGDSGWQAGGWENWSGSSARTSAETRPNLQHLSFPEYNGDKDGFEDYRWKVLNLKAQVSAQDVKYLAPRLISSLKGNLAADLARIQIPAAQFMTDTGPEDFLEYIRKRLGVTDRQMEIEAFERYFYKTKRNKGDSIRKYVNAEEHAYRKLQAIFSETASKAEAWSDDDLGLGMASAPVSPGHRRKRFQLPKRLRGWFFLSRSGIPTKDHAAILHQTRGYDIEKIKEIVLESYADDVVDQKDSHGARPPWRKTKPASANQVDDEDWWSNNDDWDDDGQEDDDHDDHNDEQDYDVADDVAGTVDDDGFF